MQFERLCKTAGLSQASFRAAKRAYRECKRALGEFDKRVDRALDDDRLSKQSKRFLRELWYGNPRDGALTLGNRTVRKAVVLANSLILLMHADQEPCARKGRTRLRMMTTTPDSGILDQGAPRLNTKAVCNHFDQAARDAGVDALGFLDLALVEDQRGQRSPQLILHMHGAIQAREPWFRTRAAERAASPARKPRNTLGLKVTKITSRKRDSSGHLGPRHVARLGYYVAKPSCGMKIVYELDGKRRSKTTLHGWDVTRALRQLECYSHCDALKTTRGVGRGKELRKSWKKLLLNILKLNGTAWGLKIDHDWLELNWRKVWHELSSHLRAATFAE